MKRTALALVASALVVLIACATSSALGTAQDTPTDSAGRVMRDLVWMCGTWRMTSEEGVTTEEHWRPLQGTTILGTSHTYDAKKSHFFEFLRVAERAGTVVYIAMPGGASPTAFQLARHGAGSEGALVGSFAEFENPQHDAPQRIRYERTATGITATISQMDGSQAQSWTLAATE